jgi:hypothetical protein
MVLNTIAARSWALIRQLLQKKIQPPEPEKRGRRALWICTFGEHIVTLLTGLLRDERPREFAPLVWERMPSLVFRKL